MTERMMLEFAESEHPIFRDTRPLSRKSAQEQKPWKIVDTLWCPFVNNGDQFSNSHFCKSAQSLRSSHKNVCVTNTKLVTLERGNPLWKENRVPHSCQTWWRQKCLGIVITLFAKIFWCNSMENELNSNHNKTNWANFVWMRGSRQRLTSDSTSWIETLKNFHNSQIRWPDVSTPCQKMKNSSETKGWIRGNFEIGPILEVTTRYLQGKYGVENYVYEQRQFSLVVQNFSWLE